MALTLVVSNPSGSARGSGSTPTVDSSRPPPVGSNETRDSRAITLDQPRIVIGRSAHVDVRLPSRAVSDKHAVVTLDGSEAALLDEGSTNGTRVNGVLVPRGRKKALKSGDIVGIGPYAIVVQVVTAMPDPPERTASLARRLLGDALRAVGSETVSSSLILASSRRAGHRWEIPNDKRRVIIGRGDGSDILLDDRDCSRHHAEVLRDGEGYLLRDLGSKNGIEFGGRSLTDRRLKHGDVFTLGKTSLRFHDPTEELLLSFEGGDDERAPTPAAPSLPPPEPTPSAPDALTHERSKVSLVPPPAKGASTPPLPAEAPLARSPRGDWLVVGLCAVILLISAIALLVVLRSPR